MCAQTVRARKNKKATIAHLQNRIHGFTVCINVFCHTRYTCDWYFCSSGERKGAFSFYIKAVAAGTLLLEIHWIEQIAHLFHDSSYHRYLHNEALNRLFEQFFVQLGTKSLQCTATDLKRLV